LESKSPASLDMGVPVPVNTVIARRQARERRARRTVNCVRSDFSAHDACRSIPMFVSRQLWQCMTCRGADWACAAVDNVNQVCVKETSWSWKRCCASKPPERSRHRADIVTKPCESSFFPLKIFNRTLGRVRGIPALIYGYKYAWHLWERFTNIIWGLCNHMSLAQVVYSRAVSGDTPIPQRHSY
jgi:hypothetical protein